MTGTAPTARRMIGPDPGRAVIPDRYRSSVCSTQESPLDRLARAIDDLAADSRDGAAHADLAERIARLWAMLADLDPELAKRRPGYEAAEDYRGPGS
jgi:hypothetical protein